MRLRAVLFDLDETLILEGAAVTDALQATARSIPPPHAVDPAAFAVTVRRCARDLWRAAPTWPWCDAIGISSWEALCSRFEGDEGMLAQLRAWAPAYRGQAWGNALREHGVADEALAGVLAATYVAEQARRRTPFPETQDVLRALHGRVRLAVVTNGDPGLQRDKLRAAGLEPWFDVVTVSGEVGAGKPDPLPFRHTLERLGVSADDAVMVGDNPDRDVAGAFAAGMRSVWVDRAGRGSEHSRGSTWRVTDLRGIPPIVSGADLKT